MALFGSKKETEKKVAKPKAEQAALAAVNTSTSEIASVIKHARITEKASMQQGSSVYVFDVATSATKRDIARAVTAIYKVVPRKVTVVSIRRKSVRNARTGRAGMKGGGKKAYVYLKSSDTINL